MDLHLFNKVSFLSYFLTSTPSMNGFAEPTATLVSELGRMVPSNAKSWLRHCPQGQGKFPQDPDMNYVNVYLSVKYV